MNRALPAVEPTTPPPAPYTMILAKFLKHSKPLHASLWAKSPPMIAPKKPPATPPRHPEANCLAKADFRGGLVRCSLDDCRMLPKEDTSFSTREIVLSRALRWCGNISQLCSQFIEEDCGKSNPNKTAIQNAGLHSISRYNPSSSISIK